MSEENPWPGTTGTHERAIVPTCILARAGKGRDATAARGVANALSADA